MRTPDTPPLHELADDLDELGWDRAVHGRMLDAAAPDDAVPTVAWTPDEAA